MRHSILILCNGLLGFANAQVIVPGTCPDVTLQHNFDLARYAGDWFGYKSYFAVFQAGGTCGRAEYTPKPDGTVRVRNSETRGGAESSIEGTAIQPNPEEPAKLLVNFPQQGSNLASYWVLGTDYENFTVVWSCTQFGAATGRFAWVMTRTPRPSQETIDAANQVLQANNIDQAPFRQTVHDDCKNY